MQEYTKSEKILYISLMVLVIFVLGVQCGIHQSRKLQMEGYKNDNYGQFYSN